MMVDRRREPVVWGVRHAKSLESKVSKVATVIGALTKRAEPYGSTHATLEQDPEALAKARDTLSIQHEELLVANEILREQLEELQSIEQVVAFERSRSDAIFLDAPDPYVLTDAVGRICEVNIAAKTLFNVAEDFLLGKPIATLVERDDADTLQGMATAATSGKTAEGRVRVRPRRTPDVVFASALVSSFDQAANLFWRFRLLHEPEIQTAETDGDDEPLARERMARIEQERANDAKDRLIALVSHDLRGPLNAILGWTEVLRESDPDEATRRKALTTIERSGRAQADLIEDLLDISRISAGKLKVDRISVDLGAIARRAVDAIRPAALAKRIALNFTPPEETLSVLGDAARLSQVLANLLGNAVKFTSPGGAIFVALSADGDDVTLSVRDTGKGIARGALATIFDYFEQEDKQASGSGLGLGLYISRQLVALHYGTLGAESAGENCGAVFTMKLPLQIRPSRADESVPALPTSSTLPRLSGVRVLIVDDDADARELAGVMLRQSGATTTLASSVKAALQTFEVFTPDVILSDIRMDAADGNDLIRALRRSKYSDVPAIAMSGDSGVADVHRSIELGFDAYLVKPIALKTLVDAVADAVEVGRAAKPRATDGSDAPVTRTNRV